MNSNNFEISIHYLDIVQLPEIDMLIVKYKLVFAKTNIMSALYEP